MRKPIAIVALFTAALFVFLHSGSRGVAECERNGFGGPGDLSAWPPGTICRGGEPTIKTVEFNSEFLVGVIVLLCAITAFVYLRRRRSGTSL